VPALPLGEAGKYVAAAYVAFLVLIVVYVAIMAAKLQRIERELRELALFAESQPGGEQAAAEDRSEEPSVSDSLASQGSRGGAPHE
jgi:CcmD family protein